MDIFSRKNERRITWGFGLVLGVLFGFLVVQNLVVALVTYPPGALLQPGDVTTSHIRDNTIIGADINFNSTFRERFASTTMLDTSVLTATSSATLASTTSYVMNVGTLNASSSATLPATTFSGMVTLPATSPTNGTHAANKSYVDSAVGSVNFQITTGQNIGAGVPVWIATTTSTGAGQSDYVASAGQNAFGKTATNVKIGQSIASTTELISKIVVRLKTYGTPTDNIILSIMGSSNKLPNENAIIASSTVAGTSVSGSYASTTFNFYPAVPIRAGVQMFIVLERSAALDDTNYYSADYDLNGAFTEGYQAPYTGGSWSAQGTVDWVFEITNSGITADQIYIASAVDSLVASSTIGFNKSAIASSSLATVAIGGASSLWTGLTHFSKYYLGNSLGVISTSAGTNSYELGRPIASTTMYVRPQILSWQ